MTAKKKSRPRREFSAGMSGGEVPLRNHAEQALHDYFASLNGHRPAQLYDLVLREVEEPLFKAGAKLQAESPNCRNFLRNVPRLMPRMPAARL